MLSKNRKLCHDLKIAFKTNAASSVHSNAMVLLLLIHFLLLHPLFVVFLFVLDPCFVMQYFVSFLVLQSSR